MSRQYPDTPAKYSKKKHPVCDKIQTVMQAKIKSACVQLEDREVEMALRLPVELLVLLLLMLMHTHRAGTRKEVEERKI